MKLLTYLQKTKQLTRRDFADMLKEQVLFVNDIPVTSFDVGISLGDRIKILIKGGDYEETISYLPSARPTLVLFHKPVWYVVSKDDPHNQTIYDILPPRRKKDFWYIGRLDKESSGLLLLTNDPKLVDRYENPKQRIHKHYEVRLDMPLRQNHVKKMTQGIRVDADGYKSATNEGEFLQCVRCSTFKDTKWNPCANIVLDAGKNRHIRRMLSALGYRVKALHRVKVGKRVLGDIKPRKWKIERISKPSQR
jgi:16S rRNA pseudouridine516 synthase